MASVGEFWWSCAVIAVHNSMVEVFLSSCIARSERSNRSAIVDLKRRSPRRRYDGDICTQSLPALLSLRSPTLGGISMDHARN
jgi:hypothetical protein